MKDDVKKLYRLVKLQRRYRKGTLTPEEIRERKKLLRLAWRIMHKLDDYQTEHIFMLRYLKGKKWLEIGFETGIYYESARKECERAVKAVCRGKR